MYAVTQPWPCQACDPPSTEEFPALAKKHTDDPRYIPEEREGLKKVCVVQLICITFSESYTIFQVQQLLDYGKGEDGSDWTIVRDMRVIPGTLDRRYRIGEIVFKHTPTREFCENTFRKTWNPLYGRLQKYIKVDGMLHCDVNIGNALLKEDLSEVVFVDWGFWMVREVRANSFFFLS
jgi:hypothetical protein